MSYPGIEALLAQIDGMPYPSRQKVLVRAARDAAKIGNIDALLRGLSDTGWWGGRTALQLADAVRHSGFILAGRSAADPVVAAQAWRLIVRYQLLPPDEIASAITDLPRAWRADIYAEVRKAADHDLADALLPTIQERFGDTEAAGLLPSCSALMVQDVLPALAHEYQNWAPLARLHPQGFLAHLRRRLESCPKADVDRVWRHHLSGISVALQFFPGVILDLMALGGGDWELPGSVKTRAGLVRHDPNAVLKLLLHPRYPAAPPTEKAFYRAFLVLGDAGLGQLARHLPSYAVESFLKVLPPSRRGMVFAALLGESSLAASGLPVTLLDLLPVATRSATAGRLLRHRSGTDDPAVQLQLTARLAWSQSRQALQTASSRPEAADRSVGYQLLISAAAGSREPAIVGEMLSLLTRLTNDQDPVRLSAISALAAVPPWLLPPESTPQVLHIAIAAIEARDCSWNTRSVVHQLAGRLLVEGVLAGRADLAEAAGLLWTRQAEQFPSIAFPRLENRLPAGGEQAVFHAVRARIVSDMSWGRHTLALDLATALRRRAYLLPELQANLAMACFASDDAVVRRAVRLWMADPATRDERVEVLVRADPTMIRLPEVRNQVGSRRTDLVDLVLHHRGGGRFESAGVVSVPDFSIHLRRWLPRQLRDYAELLLRVATDQRKPGWERAVVIRTLPRVPGPEARTSLLETGFLDDPDVAVAETALAALAHLDDPAGATAELLSRADGDQARVAMYTITRIIRYLRPDRIAAVLVPLLARRKITVRKEAVRLAAEHRIPDAAKILTDTWFSPDQYRDVKRAIVPATRGFLGQTPNSEQSCWPLIELAAKDAAIATALLVFDPERVDASVRQRLAGLMVAMAGSTDPTVRRAALQSLGIWGQWDEKSATDRLVATTCDLAGTGEWRIALNALADVMTATGNVTGARDAVVQLRLLSEPAPPLQDRDLPARQRLLAVAEMVAGAAGRHRSVRSGSGILAGDFADHQTWEPTTLQLAVAAVDWTESAENLLTTLQSAARAAERSGMVEVAAQTLRRGLERRLARPAAEDWPALVTALMHLQSRAAARFAVEIVAQVGRRQQWPTAWQEMLLQLRSSADNTTRTAALNTFIESE